MTVESMKSRCEIIPWDGCWIWMGAHSRGYGFVKTGGKSVRAHRLMWELAKGAIPEGMVVMHKCDHPGCVNPDHLSIGTQDDNISDCHTKGRGVPIVNLTCGEDRHNSKLSEFAVLMIRHCGLSNIELGRIFAVSRKTIEDVRKGKTWRHVT